MHRVLCGFAASIAPTVRPLATGREALGGDQAEGASTHSWATPSRTVKWKQLPLPTSLSTQILPCIIVTSRAEIVRPNPVPPYCRVVEPSAWVNACLLYT